MGAMGVPVLPVLDELTADELAAIPVQFSEGFDTLEIRDQIVARRLFVGEPAMITEGQIANALYHARR